MANNMRAELCEATVRSMILKYGKSSVQGIILHSDRGSQYTSDLYKTTLVKYGIRQSMNSAAGKCHDNARCESIWASMKEELIYGRYDTTKMSSNALKSLVWRYFMGYWNNRRVCSANGGLPTALTDENGNITDRFTYDTYGKLLTHTGNTDTPFMYNGRDGVVTDENGLLYMRARYYSPELKRFINADIIKGNITNNEVLNQYAYANANPVSNVDPFGLWSWAQTKQLFSGVVRVAGGISQTVAGVTTFAGGGPIGWVAGGFMVVNGIGEVFSGVKDCVNAVNNTDGKNIDAEENWMKQKATGFIGDNFGDTAAKYAGGAWDLANIAASVYGAKCEIKELNAPTMKSVTSRYNSYDGLISSAGKYGYELEAIRNAERINSLVNVSTKFARTTTLMGMPSDFATLKNVSIDFGKRLYNSDEELIKKGIYPLSYNYGGNSIEIQKGQRK